MRHAIALRILLDLLALGAVALGMVWVPIALAVVLVVFFGAWEIILVGMVMDFVWLPSAHAVPLLTLGALALAWIVEILRGHFFLTAAGSDTIR